MTALGKECVISGNCLQSRCQGKHVNLSNESLTKYK